MAGNNLRGEVNQQSSVLWAQLGPILNTFGTLFVVFLVTRWAHYYRRTPKVASVGFWPIPYLGSWVAGIKFMMHPVDQVKEGVANSSNGIFRIATLSDELTIVADSRKVAEYLKAPDSVLNMQDGANDQQQIPFTMGYGVAYRTYHNIVVRKKITPNIPSFNSEMVEEVALAFQELIGTLDTFTPVPFYPTIAMIVARASNRLFAGKDMARNTNYLRNATEYSQAVVISAEILRLFPHWAKGFVVKILPVTGCMRKAVRYLGPQVKKRLDREYTDGKKPNDLIQWLIEAAPPAELTVYQIVERVMALNVASIHTTTMTFTAAIYTLAADPERYIEILRAEVADNLEHGHITYNTVQKLVYIESFMRESARFNVAGLAAMQRNARQLFTFSDGTVIPKGAKVASPSLIMHRDPMAYKDPETFDGFRFVKIRDGVPELVKSMVSGGTDFHTFGHGRHPCPGRFFATHEMKIMFATMILHYDFKLAPGTKPKELFVATMALPDTTLKVLLRSRVLKETRCGKN